MRSRDRYVPAARKRSVVRETAVLTMNSVSPRRDPFAHAPREEVDLTVEVLDRPAFQDECVEDGRQPAREARILDGAGKTSVAYRVDGRSQIVERRVRRGDLAQQCLLDCVSSTDSSPASTSASSTCCSRERSSSSALATVEIIAGSSSTTQRVARKVVEDGGAFVESERQPRLGTSLPRSKKAVRSRRTRRGRRSVEDALPEHVAWNLAPRYDVEPIRSLASLRCDSRSKTAHALDRVAEELDRAPARRPSPRKGRECRRGRRTRRRR